MKSYEDHIDIFSLGTKASELIRNFRLMMKNLVCVFILSSLFSMSCRRDPSIVVRDPHYKPYKTRKVVVVSVDGPRWSETWGDPNYQYIPHRGFDLLPKGVLLTSFSNMGFTYTNSGHTAMLTGVYQPINNSGQESPAEPNIFQYLQSNTHLPHDKCWLISSKDKLQALGDCVNPDWAGRFVPGTDCGVNGLGSGYREDSVTLVEAIQVFEIYRPTLALVHFREPDYSAHSGNWDNYLRGIQTTDEYVWSIWNYLQSDSTYSGVTTLFVTNDHGRHLDNVLDGFVSHGDNCWGCRHIELLAIGPDFKSGRKLNTPYELRDIPTTIGELLHFSTPRSEGRVMWELFK
jgi:hypothetical protein